MVENDTKKNVLTYYLNFAVAAVVGLVANPLILHALGPVPFGVWKSVQRFLDFATVADGRASQALKWIVASRSGSSDLDKRRDIGAAIIVWFRWLPIAMLVAAGVTAALPILIHGIPTDLRAAAYWTAAILAANTVLAGLLAIPDSVLTGINQGYKSMLITTAVFVVMNGLLVLAAVSGLPLWSLAIITLTAAVLNTMLTLLVAKSAVSWWGISRPTKSDIKRVFSYSSWTLGWSLVEKLFISSELIIISIMIGATGVTKYTFTTFVIQFVLSIALVTASGFMPVLGTLLGQSDHAAAAERAKFVRHLVIGIASMGAAAVIAFNGIFVSLWAGNAQYMGNFSNALLAIGGLQLALIRMDGQILDVTMKIAPKVSVGACTSISSILAGCITLAIWHELNFALLAVIAVRLLCSVAYPSFVARAVPGSSVPVRTVLLASALVCFSLIVAPLTQSGGLLEIAMLASVWLSAAMLAAWVGLVPRAILQAVHLRMR